jgi:hypothetical protein
MGYSEPEEEAPVSVIGQNSPATTPAVENPRAPKATGAATPTTIAPPATQAAFFMRSSIV